MTTTKPSILILSQYYVPESGAPSNRWHCLATSLVKLGHSVQVLTSMPNYPTGSIFEGYRGGLFRQETIGEIRVYRAWLYATSSRKLTLRMLNYLSFGLMALVVGFFWVRKCDLMIWESPPLFLGPFARVLAWLKRTKCVMNVSDLWPESAVAMELVSKDGLATRMAEKLEMWLYRNSDAVTGQTNGIVESIAARVPGVPVHLFPNGVDLKMFRPGDSQKELAIEFDISGKFVVGYGGIMGYAQALDQVLGAAALLKENSDILFAFFGDGPLKKDLIAKAERMDLTNVRFFPRQDRQRMPSITGLWDVGMVPLADHLLFSGARPSKMFELMGLGKPVLYCGRGEGAAIVRDAACGVVVPPERPEKLADAVKQLHADRERLKQMGRNGRRAAEEKFDRDKIAARMSKLFQSLV